MTSQPAYGLTHAYLVGQVACVTLAQALRAMVNQGLTPKDISFAPFDWSK